MLKAISLSLLAAPLSAMASPLTIQAEGFYNLLHGGSAIGHAWRGNIPVELDKKTELDRTKKESCTSGGICKSFELVTEVTAHDLGDGAIKLEVDFTNTSEQGTIRIEGNLITHLDDSAKFEIKSEDRGDHFSLHLSPKMKREENQ